jgi:hypothetical protein
MGPGSMGSTALSDRPTDDFLDVFDKMLDAAIRPFATPAELVTSLNQIYRLAYDADIGRFDVERMRLSAEPMRRAVFHLQMAIRDQLSDWHQRGLMTREAQQTLREVFRALRYTGEMIDELAVSFKRVDLATHSPRAFAEPAKDTQFHATTAAGLPIRFQSGDVLAVRGLLTNSAAIARIGEDDSQFSHLCIVHIDEAGKAWVVESLIEEGAIINTLEHALGHGVGRAVLFRHPDAEMARRAAAHAYEVVKRSRSQGGKRILYDFTMQLTGYRGLSCAKLVRMSYDHASGGKLLLPTFATRFPAANKRFLRQVGVRSRETFAPGDMELQPDFAFVAEWSDPLLTSRLRTQDIVLTKIFEWMEVQGWRFRGDWTVGVIAFFGRLAAHLSDGAKNMIASVVPKVPINMPRRTIAIIAMLHKTVVPLVDEIEALDKDRLRKTGHPLHPREIYAHLDRVRARADGRIGYLYAPRT